MKIMKDIYYALYFLMCAFVASFFRYSFSEYKDYIQNKDMYMVQSAPWYIGILANAMINAILVLIIIIVMKIIKKKLDNKENK